jgi:hypothetical protein
VLAASFPDVTCVCGHSCHRRPCGVGHLVCSSRCAAQPAVVLQCLRVDRVCCCSASLSGCAPVYMPVCVFIHPACCCSPQKQRAIHTLRRPRTAVKHNHSCARVRAAPHHPPSCAACTNGMVTPILTSETTTAPTCANHTRATAQSTVAPALLVGVSSPCRSHHCCGVATHGDVPV